MAGGATTAVLNDGMTRGPVLRVPSVADGARIKAWMEAPESFMKVAEAFNSTSRFARLDSVKTMVSGRYVFMRFRAITGDAMGMNMITKVQTASTRRTWHMVICIPAL